MQRNKNYENIVRMGLRGDRDMLKQDFGNAEANFKELERIMNDQREIIKKVTQKPTSVYNASKKANFETVPTIKNLFHWGMN